MCQSTASEVLLRWWIGGIAAGLVSVLPLPAVGQSPGDMVLIPGGQFQMGDHHEGDPFGDAPLHAVYVDSFYMDVYEVTNEQYADALNWAYGQGLIDNPDAHDGVVLGSGGGEVYCDTTTSTPYSRITWNGSTFGVMADKEDHPMVGVSWYGAVAYCNWRSAQEGRNPTYDLTTWECDFDANGYRLPTEAEWEYSARGGLHTECTEAPPYCRYPWGDAPGGSKANYWNSGDPYDGSTPETTPVGYYDGNQTPSGSDMANGYGLYDMAGNVAEWCNDWRDADYYDSSPYGNPRGPASGTNRVARGGSWVNQLFYLRCAYRGGTFPDALNPLLGFRLLLAPVCGDGICEGDEDGCNCPQDCGPCTAPTASTWSMAIAGLLVLILGTLAIRRRVVG